MGTMTLRRARDTAGLNREMEFWVGGELVARLRRGQAVTVEVESRDVQVQARMDWCTSHEIQVSGGDLPVTVTAAMSFFAIWKLYFRPEELIRIRTKQTA